MRLVDWWLGRMAEQERQAFERAIPERERRMRVTRLGTYNAERSRGIVHTKDWDDLMAQEQAAFNRGEMG